MHKTVRITVRGRQAAQLISPLANTRVVTATIKSAGDSFNGKYQRGTDASVMKWACHGQPVTPESRSAVCRWMRSNALAKSAEALAL